MEYFDRPHPDFIIYFDINSGARSVIDELAFAYLVQMNFAGTIYETGKFSEGRKTIFRVGIKFKDYGAFDGAKGHCSRNLTRTGRIKSDYVGALNAADPQRSGAKNLQAKCAAGK